MPAQTLAEAEMPSHGFMFGFFMLGTVLTYFGNILVNARSRYLEIRFRQQLEANRYMQYMPTTSNSAPQLASPSYIIKNLILDKRLSAAQVDAMVVPDFMKCKGTGKLMRDPVATINGDIFDREYIEKYLRDHNNVDPNGKQLENNWLFPDVDLRRQIMEAIEKYAAELATRNAQATARRNFGPILTYLQNIHFQRPSLPAPVPSAETMRELRQNFLDGLERAFGTQEAPRPTV